MRIVWASLLIGLVLTGCAHPPQAATPASAAFAPPTEWQGRLYVTVLSDPPTSLGARFLLQGNARKGSLDLYSPLGTTFAALQWSPFSAQLDDGRQSQRFDSLAALTEKVTGTALPMAAIFEWLQGQEVAIAGWQTDLSAAQQGNFQARRLSPQPEVTLRIQLD
ncbi:MAG: hypothetical protein RLY41_1187 [Pseudomonadota bacterium]